MSKFITGQELETVIYNIIWEAKETLLIVSPYIKLDSYFRKLFDHHLENQKLHIIIVFGKNEGDVNKSLAKDDFEYFKKFIKISIIHIPNLHAKYYGNELQGVITSINLHDYSFKNNIEFGVFDQINLFNSLSQTVDKLAWNTCNELADNGDVVFISRPVYQKKLFLKTYMSAKILEDNTESYYKYNSRVYKNTKKLPDYPVELEFGTKSETRPERHEVESKRSSIDTKTRSHSPSGYCIRTGKPIPFNPSAPFCYEAYQSWAQWGNADYPENFCHKTGQPSNGKTSKNNPILKHSNSRW